MVCRRVPVTNRRMRDARIHVRHRLQGRRRFEDGSVHRPSVARRTRMTRPCERRGILARRAYQRADGGARRGGTSPTTGGGFAKTSLASEVRQTRLRLHVRLPLSTVVSTACSRLSTARRTIARAGYSECHTVGRRYTRLRHVYVARCVRQRHSRPVCTTDEIHHGPRVSTWLHRAMTGTCDRRVSGTRHARRRVTPPRRYPADSRTGRERRA